MDIGELKIRKLLLCAAKVLHHSSHEHFILLFKTVVDAFQLRFEFVKMRWDLA